MAIPHITRRDEYEAAFYAYRAGMARVSNAAAYVALARWRQQVAALRPDANPAFIASLVPLVWGARRLSRRLTQSWYVYARVLDSGVLFGDSESGATSLDGLREDFFARLQDAASLGHELSDDEETREFEQALLEFDYSTESASERPNPRAARLDRGLLDRELQEFLDKWGADRPVNGRDPYAWSTDSNPEDLARYLDRELRDIAREQSQDRRRTLEERAREREREATDEEYKDAHDRVGQKVAGEVHRLVSDAADSNIRRALGRDRRVMQVARGTALRPCSFCAMLASRGFEYTSVATASFKPHSNCNCYPIVRWTTVRDDDLPQINKWFQDLWNDSTKGLSGAEARNAFRRRLNQEFGDNV